MLRSADEVLALQPRLSSESTLEIGVVAPKVPMAPGKVGVVGPHGGAGAKTALEVRAFFPAPGGTLAEDALTGSLDAALAQWLIGDGLAPARHVAAQGTAPGRAGRGFVDRDGETIWIGGHSVIVIDGHAVLPSAPSRTA